MRTTLIGLCVMAATMCVSVSAMADDAPAFNSDNHFRLGMSADLGIPSGATLGIQVRLPYVPWTKIGVAGTYLLAPGGRGNILIDPIKFVIAPVAIFDLGYQSSFAVPGMSNSPD